MSSLKQNHSIWRQISKQKKVFDNFQEKVENKAKADRKLYNGKEELVLITEIWEKPEDYDEKLIILLGEPLIILANGIPIWSKRAIAKTTRITKEEYKQRFKK